MSNEPVPPLIRASVEAIQHVNAKLDKLGADTVEILNIMATANETLSERMEQQEAKMSNMETALLQDGDAPTEAKATEEADGRGVTDEGKEVENKAETPPPRPEDHNSTRSLQSQPAASPFGPFEPIERDREFKLEDVKFTLGGVMAAPASLMLFCAPIIGWRYDGFPRAVVFFLFSFVPAFMYVAIVMGPYEARMKPKKRNGESDLGKNPRPSPSPKYDINLMPHLKDSDEANSLEDSKLERSPSPLHSNKCGSNETTPSAQDTGPLLISNANNTTSTSVTLPHVIYPSAALTVLFGMYFIWLEWDRDSWNAILVIGIYIAAMYGVMHTIEGVVKRQIAKVRAEYELPL